jgi:hypothetical protein
MTSVFDVGTIGVDEDDELNIEFTAEFLELSIDERIELLCNLSDYAMGIVDSVYDEEDFELAGEHPLEDEEEEEEDDDAFDAEELA